MDAIADLDEGNITAQATLNDLTVSLKWSDVGNFPVYLVQVPFSSNCLYQNYVDPFEKCCCTSMSNCNFVLLVIHCQQIIGSSWHYPVLSIAGPCESCISLKHDFHNFGNYIVHVPAVIFITVGHFLIVLAVHLSQPSLPLHSYYSRQDISISNYR